MLVVLCSHIYMHQQSIMNENRFKNKEKKLQQWHYNNNINRQNPKVMQVSFVQSL